MFAPRYSANYRIVAIHGPNRIVVRDEKGNKTVRRASHLKVCDLKAKVTSMIPEQNEYSSFGRSTKLLLHPKNVLDLHFSSKTEERGKISSELETSKIRNVPNPQSGSKTEVRGEISPEIETAEIQNISNPQSNTNSKNRSEISPKTDIAAAPDVPDLQFSSKAEERGKIPLEAENSVVQEVMKKMENINLCGETSPQSHEVIKTQITKTCHEYIVGYTEKTD